MSKSDSLGFSAEDYMHISLLIAETLISVAGGEPSRFLHQWEGKILLHLEDDCTTLPIGVFSVMVADIEGAVCESAHAFDVFDSESSSFGYYEALYEGGSDIKEKVARLACGDDYLWRPNLLMLDRLAIFPEHRGKNAGLLVLRTLMERFRPGVGLIAMKPFPLQFEVSPKDEIDGVDRSALGLDLLKGSARAATVKLRKYYRALGFKAVPGTEYMVRSAEIPLPNVESLTRPALESH